jgi:hypothetical protein
MADNDKVPAASGPEAGWIADLGISDRPSGHAAATGAHQWLVNTGEEVHAHAPATWTMEWMVFSGLLTRAYGCHRGALAAADADNPYAAFPVLRSYAENAAVLLWCRDKHASLTGTWFYPSGALTDIGKLVAHAERTHPGFRQMYAELSKYAHPGAASIMVSTRNVSGTRFDWHDQPRFGSESDALVAYAWCVRLAEINAVAMLEFAQALGMIRHDPWAGDGAESGAAPPGQ